MKAALDLVRRRLEKDPLDEQKKSSWSRLWLGRWLWWTIGASTYVLLRAPDDALVAVVEVVLGSMALAIALALIGAMGLPRSFQYIAPAVSAAAGKIRDRVSSWGSPSTPTVVDPSPEPFIRTDQEQEP